MKTWKFHYEIDDDNYEGAPRMRYSIKIEAKTAQDAVNILRNKYKPRHRLKINNVWQTDHYETFTKKTHDWQ